MRSHILLYTYIHAYKKIDISDFHYLDLIVSRSPISNVLLLHNTGSELVQFKLTKLLPHSYVTHGVITVQLSDTYLTNSSHKNTAHN